MQGTQSTNTLLGIVPSCTVTVYLTGTTTKAAIFSNASGTTLSNPFTANAINSINPGGWIFWSAVNTGYDIVLSGGIPPNAYASPVTLTDRYPGFSFSGGGGSVTPCGTVGQIQVANAAGTALDCDSNFTINTLTHTRISTANEVVSAVTSVPRAVVDPMDTQFLGGLAAAVAGTSGHTPTQVLNAAADYGYCLSKGSNNTGGAWIRTPAGWTLGLDSVKLWPKERIGSDSVATQTYFGHSGSATGPMVTGHSNTDTIVCNGSTFTPGTATLNEVAFIAISGSFTGANDIGILGNGFEWYNHDIQGWGTQFGQQAIWTTGTSAYDTREGFPGAQISGCADFTRGVSTGTCEAVELGQLDGFADHIYATDAAEQLTGKGPGACYPNCAAIGANGANMEADSLFAQISDIGIIAAGQGVRGSNWRIDGSSMEALRITNSFSSALVNNIYALGPCLSTSLQSAFNAGTATGCFTINNVVGQANQVYGIGGGGSTFFGSSYVQCLINDPTNSASAQASTWGLIGFQGLPQNTTSNSMAFCGTNNSSASGRIFLPASGVVPVSTATVNMNGITNMLIQSGLTVTNFTNGIPGVVTMIQGSILGPATVAVGGNFHSCNGLNETVSSVKFIQVTASGQDGQVYEICPAPNITPAHINWNGNPIPTNQYTFDMYGNGIDRQIPDITLLVNQLHGPNAGSGNQCFEEEAVYADGNHNVSPLACTTVDLAHQTPGEIFGTPSTLAVTYNLYLVSNTTGNGVALGKYPSGGPSLFWDGPTTIAAGGNGSTPPTAGENNTGMYFFPWGPVVNTTGNSQPPCTVVTRGRLWVLSGGGTGPDTPQICVETTGSTYAWINL